MSPKVGDTITVKQGYGYTVHDPQAFRRSDGTVQGTIYATQGRRVYFRLTIADKATGGTNAETQDGCFDVTSAGGPA